MIDHNDHDIIQTKNNHDYMINRNHKQVMLLHPELKKIIETGDESNGYHQRYLEFLKEHGFFTAKEKTLYFEDLKVEDVSEFFFNVGNVLFEVTEKCNLNCVYCCYGDLYSHQKHRERRSQKLENAITLLSYIVENKESQTTRRRNRNMHLSFYGGEPLLDMTFIKETVKYSKTLAAKYDMQFGYGLNTNGILLDKHMDFFADNDFQLLISLDGDAEASSYRVCENSKRLQRDFPDYFEKRVNFSVVLHNRNTYHGALDYFKREFDVTPVKI